MKIDRRLVVAFCLCLAVFVACRGYASGGALSVFDMSLEELVQLEITVASKRAEYLRDAPAVMTVVTRAEIEALGARNLMDIVNRLPSMIVLGQSGFYANKTQIRAQPNSSQNRHTLILINGRPVRETINGGNNAYLYLGFPISVIESIEVIRGPGSVLYGSNAFAAVINIKTRSLADVGSVSKVSVTYGSYDTQDYNAFMMGNTRNAVDYLVAARISRSGGPRIAWADAAGNPGSFRYSDDADSVYVNIGNQRIGLQAAYHRYSPAPYGFLGALTDAVYIDQVEAFFADTEMKYDFTDEILGQLNLTINTFSWDGSNDGVTYFQRRRARNLLLEPMVMYSPGEAVNIIAGGTLEHDDFGGAELHGRSRYIYSFYTQADWAIASWFKPLVGLQYNKTENVQGNYSPLVGLVLTPADRWGLKLLYSEAFRRAFPAETDLDSLFLLGNPDLTPEIIETYEAQVYYESQTFQVDLTYFHSRQDLIEVDFNAQPLIFMNYSGDMKTEGLELTGHANLGRHWKTLGSAMVQSTDNHTGEPILTPNYPDYMIKGGLIGKYGKTDFGLFNSYFATGDRHERFNNLQANVSFDISRLVHMPADHAGFSIFFDNILDEKPFNLPTSIGINEPMPQYYGRRVYATVQVKW